MDYPDFLQRLHEGISEPSGSGRNKQIITFDKPHQYRECLSYLRKLKPELAGLRQVQPARLIRALIAPLSGETGWANITTVLPLKKIPA